MQIKENTVKASYEVVRKAMLETCRPSNMNGYVTAAEAFNWSLSEILTEIESRGEELTHTEAYLKNHYFRINASVNIG